MPGGLRDTMSAPGRKVSIIGMSGGGSIEIACLCGTAPALSPLRHGAFCKVAVRVSESVA
jgi:hypothetical protein